MTEQTEKAEQAEDRIDLSNIGKAKMQGEYVLIRQWSSERVTKGGIVMPSGTEKKLGAGTVLKIGSAVPEDCGIAVGDVAVFPLHAPEPLTAVNDDENIVYAAYRDLILIYPQE